MIRTASKYAWGIGFHWYEDWSGGQPMYENVKRVHEAYPIKILCLQKVAVKNLLLRV
jgi:glucosylceramidase